MANLDKKLTDCYWYLQSGCNKGAECEYRHSPEALNNQTVCKFWQEKKCTNPKCTFRHPSISSTPCQYFAMGNCTKGDRCSYAHSSPQGEYFPKAAPQSAVAPSNTENKALQEKEDELLKLKEEFQKAQEKLKKMEQAATTTSSAPPTSRKRTNEQITDNKVSIQTSALSSSKPKNNNKMSINTSTLSSSSAANKMSIDTTMLSSSKPKPKEKIEENNQKRKPRAEPKAPASNGKLDFGIKSLNELTKETPKKEEKPQEAKTKKPEQTIYQPKRATSAENATTTPAPSVPTPSVPTPIVKASSSGVSSEQLSADRMKNRLAKFGNNTQPATTSPKSIPTPAVVPATTQSSENHTKRQKTDNVAAPVPATLPPKLAIPPPSDITPSPIPPSPKMATKSILRVGSSLEDDDLELNTNQSSSNIAQAGMDDLDKELDDLMT